MKRLGKIVGVMLLVALLLAVLVAFALTRQGIQNKLAGKATKWLSQKLDTKVSIDKVKVDFLHRVHFEGLYIEDHQDDTLAYINDFSVNSSHLISDWWNDRTSIIKDVRLQGGVINLHRPKDLAEWNFAFIEEAFATDTKDSSASENPKIDLKNVSLQDVQFRMLDEWVGQNLSTDIGELVLKVNGLDLDAKRIDVKSIALTESSVSFKDFKGGKPKSTKKSDHSSWGTAFNSENVALELEELRIKNVNFEYQLNGHQSVPHLFDERHIVARNIQLNAEKFKIRGDTLTGDILHLSAIERCGLVLKKLKGHVTLHQQKAELRDMYIQTNRSVLRDYYRMNYANFHDFNEYIDNVKMYARFKNSIVDKRDIAFFAGHVKQLPLVTHLDGKGEGTVKDLYIPEIHAVTKNLNFKGSGRIIGLPDVNNTYFDIHADRLVTTGNEVIRIAPEANTNAIQWNGLSQINFVGNFKGSTKKFNTDGQLQTNHGYADVDLFMNLENQLPSYNGKLIAHKLDLGKILGRKDIGIITANGTIRGAGFDFNSLSAAVNADVKEIVFDGNQYENIQLNGTVANKQFEGLAKSADKQLGFDFEGKLDLSGEQAAYDFKSDIIKVNLKTLGVTQQDVYLTSKVNLDFTGNTLDGFIGKAIMQDAVLRYDNEVIRIPRLRLNSYYIDTIGKVLDLKSTVADARIEGQYSFEGIDHSIRSFLHYYLPTYIKQVSLPDNESFDFNVLVKNANTIIQIYEPKLKVDSGTIVTGNLNTGRQQLNLTATAPHVTYDGVHLKDVGIQSAGTPLILNSQIVASKLYVGDADIIKDANLNLAMSNDTIHFNLKTNPVDDFLGEAELDGKATAFTDRIELLVNPSTFILKDDKYRLYAYDPILYTNDGKLLAKDVIVQNGNQQLVLNTDYDGVYNNALLEAQNLDLEKITAYLNTDAIRLQGRANTTMNIKDLWGQFITNGTIHTVDDLRVNGDTLGQASIVFNYNKDAQELLIGKESKIENQQAQLYTSGKLNFDKNEIDLNATLNNTPIGFVNQYINDIVDSLHGEATGKVAIMGAIDNPIMVGNLQVKNAALKLLFTGCSYSMDDIDVNLSKNAIRFNPIRIYDERTEKQGSALLTGLISHSSYDQYRLKLAIKSENILGLNTDEFNSEMFYGYIPTKLDMKITGAFDDITMDIKAEPLENSEFYLPLEDDGAVGNYDFITYKTLGKFQEQLKPKESKPSYVKVKMNVKATPKVLATIILDPNTQEKIEARGSGNIVIDVDLGNNISMRNTYTVDEGIYKFNFRGLLSRDFELEKGGTITWYNDPYNAILDMKAIYSLKASLYPLVSDQVITDEEELKSLKKMKETHVSIDLNGPLSNPGINFDITQPYDRSIGGPGLVKLKEVRSSPTDVIYQAGMLLLFNTFKPASGGLNTGDLARNTSISTASDLVGDVLSRQLTNTIGKLGIPNLTFDIGFKRYSADIGSGGVVGSRDQVNLGLQASFFNERFLVDFGNTLDFASAASQAGGARGFTYNGDFRGQYLITLDGRYRVNAFVNTFDYVDNRPETRAGFGLTFKKTFNNWRDLFKRDKKNKEEDPTTDKDQKTGSLKKEEPSLSTALEVLSQYSY